MHRVIWAVYSVIQAQFSAHNSQVQCTACCQQTPNQYTATVHHYMHTNNLDAETYWLKTLYSACG